MNMDLYQAHQELYEAYRKAKSAYEAECLKDLESFPPENKAIGQLIVVAAKDAFDRGFDAAVKANDSIRASKRPFER